MSLTAGNASRIGLRPRSAASNERGLAARTTSASPSCVKIASVPGSSNSFGIRNAWFAPLRNRLTCRPPDLSCIGPSIGHAPRKSTASGEYNSLQCLRGCACCLCGFSGLRFFRGYTELAFCVGEACCNLVKPGSTRFVRRGHAAQPCSVEACHA
jgi:hypothetical protein